MVVRISVDPKLERAERLVTLLDHPNWGELRNVAKERMDKRFTFLAKQLMSGKRVTHGEQQFWRGYFAGMKFLLDQPDLHQKKLDKAYEESRQNDER